MMMEITLHSSSMMGAIMNQAMEDTSVTPSVPVNAEVHFADTSEVELLIFNLNM